MGDDFFDPFKKKKHGHYDDSDDDESYKLILNKILSNRKLLIFAGIGFILIIIIFIVLIWMFLPLLMSILQGLIKIDLKGLLDLLLQEIKK